jgi:hypothetical protein
MTQIYKENVMVNREPMAPDTGIMEYSEKARQGFVGNIEKTIDVELERRVKQEKATQDLAELEIKALYNNAKTLYPNDFKQYKKTVTEGLNKIYSAVPEGPKKMHLMAETQIFGSTVDTDVYKGQLDKQENIWKTRQRDVTLQSANQAVQALGKAYVSPKQLATYTPEERQQMALAAKDAELALWKSYNQRNMYDRNGNPLFSDSERAALEDRWQNRGFYGVLSYAQANVQTNYNGVVDTLDYLKSNKKEAMQQYGMSDTAYLNTINSMEKIISGQITPEQEIENNVAMVTDKANYQALNLKKDKKTGEVTVGNPKKNNLNETVAVYTQLRANENNYVDRDKYNKDIADVTNVIVNQVEKKVGVSTKGGQKQFLFLKLGNANAGQVAVQQVNDNLKDVVSSLGITDPDQINRIKADMYVDTLSQLQTAQVDLTGKQNLDVSRKVANSAYLNYVERVVGKIDIPEGTDPKLALKDRLSQYNHTQSVATLQNEILNYGN